MTLVYGFFQTDCFLNSMWPPELLECKPPPSCSLHGLHQNMSSDNAELLLWIEGYLARSVIVCISTDGPLLALGTVMAQHLACNGSRSDMQGLKITWPAQESFIKSVAAWEASASIARSS
jgi:hypothetical protein